MDEQQVVAQSKADDDRVGKANAEGRSANGSIMRGLLVIVAVVALLALLNLGWAIWWGVALALVLTARARRQRCTWDSRRAKRRLVVGIVIIAAAQIGTRLVLRAYGPRIVFTVPVFILALPGYIQWFGVYWIAMAIFRLRDLKKPNALPPCSAIVVEKSRYRK